MDLQYLSAYNEVVLNNFDAVLKQNFMFQTQIKFLEEKAIKCGELEKQLVDLTNENETIIKYENEITELKKQLDFKTAVIQGSNNVDNERHRLQLAVNDQLKEIESLKSLANAKDAEIDILKKSIVYSTVQNDKQNLKLEEMLPAIKKKIGDTVPEVIKKSIGEKPQAKDDISVLKFASDGGTF